MTDYATRTNTSDYRERQLVYVTNVTNQEKLNVPIKFILNNSNFNFHTARADGLDLRLCESSNGSGTLKMWVASWDQNIQRGIVWFKLPKLLSSETKTLYAYWGNAQDTGISNIMELTNGTYKDYGPNTCVSGTASANGYHGTNYPSLAFDASASTYWRVTISDDPLPAWLKYDFGPGEVRRIERVKLGMLTSSNTGPKDMEIQGSNDDLNWTTLYSASMDEYWALGGSTVQYAYINFDNSTAYRYIRLYITSAWYLYIYIYVFEMYETIHSETLTGGCFLFADDFDEDNLGSMWETFGAYSVSNSILRLPQYCRIKTTDPVISTTSWVLYEGGGYHDPPNVYNYKLHEHFFWGGENALDIAYYDYGTTARQDNFESGGDKVSDPGEYRTIEPHSSQLIYEAYVERTDFVYQGMLNRLTYPDYNDTWERKVHRNTEVNRLNIIGKDNSSQTSYPIDWVVILAYDPATEPVLNIDNLLIPYETISHQPLDYADYTTDITSVDFFHSSDVGGNPYHLSDNITNSLANVWISNTATTSGNLIIDFGRNKNNIASNNYLHFDNNHVTFYAAAKLSDRQTDVYGANYWQATTSSGVWAAIKFPIAKAVSCITVRAKASDLNGMIKDYKVYATNLDPRTSEESEWILLASGTFAKTAQTQNIYLNRGRYYYYILKAINSYGSNVALEEWEFYEYDPSLRKRSVAQLRLYPVKTASQESYFAKNIKFYGGNDGVNWTLLETVETYTPFVDATYGRWQRYSITNPNAYYMYRLEVIDNWYAITDQIKIAEWEMVEKASEAYNHRILFGSSDGYSQIWTDPTTTFENGNIYALNNLLNVIYSDYNVASYYDIPAVSGVGYWQDTGQLTADLTTGGIATASLATYNGDPNYAPEKAFDDSLSTYWHSVLYSSYPIWIQYQFTSPQRITYMRMYPRTSFTSRMPGDFALKGSNTGAFAGEEVVIYTVTGATYTNGQWTEFSFTNTNSYLYYRIHITNKAVGSGTGNYMNIYEIEMKSSVQEWIETTTDEVNDINVVV